MYKLKLSTVIKKCDGIKSSGTYFILKCSGDLKYSRIKLN